MGKNKFAKTRFGQFWSRKGFYIALALCMIAVGGAAWGTFDGFGVLRNESPPQSAEPQRPVEQPAASNVPLRPIIEESSAPASKAGSAIASSSSAPPSSVPEPEASQAVAPKPQMYIYPASAEVSKPFGGEKLVYSETMKDWRVHDGVDLALERGGIVRAMTDGVVENVYDDDLLGKIVSIDHGDGLVAYYCGLGRTVSIRRGDEVETGQQLGTVGETPCEVIEPTHLHFRLTLNGEAIDPVDFLTEKNAH